MLKKINIQTKFNKYLVEKLNFNKKTERKINESLFNSKTLINVDIQPEYEKFISFNLDEWKDFINKNSDKNVIIFLYNGYDTLGMVEESEYKDWLIELGIDEDVIYNATFYDKGYAFFRYCMDNSIEEENIVDFVKFMINNDINDSRDIDEDMWNKYMTEMERDNDDVHDLLENSDDMINIPDLMDFLKEYNNIVLLGGGINECLKEVEIALLALDKNYNTVSEFIY